MAARSTVQAGDWGTPATWSSGVVPDDGDTVTLTHAVSVTDARTVGHSPGAADATAAILISTGGSLTISGTGILTCRGDLKIANATTLTINGAGILEFDASAAGTPATARYVLQIGTAANHTTAKLLGTGTANANGQRLTIRSNASGANARITAGGNNSGFHDLRYFHLLRVGDSANALATVNDLSGAALTFRLRDGLIEACGIYTPTVNAPTSIFHLDRVMTTGGVGTTYDIQVTCGGTFTSGTRSVTFNSFSKRAYFPGVVGLTIEDNYFPKDGVLTTSNSAWVSFRRNLCQVTNNAVTAIIVGDYIENYYLLNSHSGGVHGPSGPTIAGSNPICSDNIFDSVHIDETGDIVQGTSPASPGTLLVTRNLFLPGSAGKGFGESVAHLGGPNATHTVTHNTWIGGRSTSVANSSGMSGVKVGETYAGRQGYIAANKSNLAYSFGFNVVGANHLWVATQRVVSGATRANPCVITSTAHGMYNGTLVVINGVGGMTQLNGGTYTVANRTANTFELQGVDSTGYGTFTSGGEIGVEDVCPPTEADYNGGWNLTPGQGGVGKPGYVSSSTYARVFSADTYGTHDVIADPRFVDATSSKWRCYALFDPDYLGNTAPQGTWSSGGSYSVGDIVAHSDPTRWGGRTANWRCIQAHAGNTANSTPSTGSNWGTYWELATDFRLREGVPLATYTPGVPQATMKDLLEWAKDGWRPTNPVYRNAGHDGATMGFGEGVFASGTPGVNRQFAGRVGRVDAGDGVTATPFLSETFGVTP